MNENDVLATLIVATAAVKVTVAVLSHRRALRAADRKTTTTAKEPAQ